MNKSINIKEEILEKEFEQFINPLEYSMNGVGSRVPINTKDGVADLGTMIFLEVKAQIKDFLSNSLDRMEREVREETRKQTLVDVLHMVDSKYQIFKLDVAFVEIMNELKAKYGIEEKPKA